MFVTVELLKKLKACDDQRRKFALLFPFGVELTRELIVNHAQEFDWRWCACNLAGATAYAVYLQTEATAFAAYLQAEATAFAAYLQAEAEAWDAYRQVERPARAAYTLACANAFADAMGL